MPGAAVVATAQVALSLLLYGLYRFGFARLATREDPLDPKEGPDHVALDAR